MCIAILNRKSTLEIDTLKNSWDNNNQGGGLLYNINGVLTCFKTYSFKEFYEFYYKLRGEIDTPIILHFRIATSGKKGKENLHPFFVNPDLGFVHNGIISGLGSIDYSDTYEFNEYLKTLPENFLENQFMLELIHNYIGWSKLIFLDKDDSYLIIGEYDGHWDKIGNWYSNDSYQSINDFEYFGNKKVKKGVDNNKSVAKPYYWSDGDDNIDDYRKEAFFKNSYYSFDSITY